MKRILERQEFEVAGGDVGDSEGDHEGLEGGCGDWEECGGGYVLQCYMNTNNIYDTIQKL